ncbi:MAG: hypothetical protein M3R00_00245 [Pseudomonadota bacterium]|nr:hypothetical protein [Pseudomonadota bacterium]
MLYRQWAKRLFVFFVVIITVSSLGLYFFMRHIDHHKDSIERWLSELTQQTVRMGDIHAGLYHWHPAIHAHHLEVFADDQKTVVARLSDLNVSIALWRSLFKWELVPSHITVTGAHLDVVQNLHGDLCLKGVKPRQQSNLKDFTWLFASGKKTLKQCTITIDGACGKPITVQLNGQFGGKWVPGSKPMLDVKLAFSVNDMQNLSHYLPKETLGPRLMAWLSGAIKSGSLQQGKLVLKGPMDDFPFDHGEGEFLVSANIHNMLLQFNSDWPMIDGFTGRIQFHKRQMDIVATGGEMHHCQIKRGLAQIKNVGDAYLTVDGELQGDMANADYIVNHSPLKYTLGKEIQNLTFTGLMSLNLKLGSSFAIPRPPMAVQGDIILQGSQCHVGQTPLVAKALRGKIHFTADSVFADNVTGSFLSNKISLLINTLKDKSDVNTTQVILNGQLDAAAAEQEFGWPILKKCRGKSPFQATLKLHRYSAPEPDEIIIESSLQGIALDLPTPLSKKAESEFKLSSHLLFAHSGEHQLQFALGEQLHVQCAILPTPAWSISGATVTLGAAKMLAPFTGQLSINGHWPEFDLSAWQSLHQPKLQPSGTSLTKKIHVSFDRVTALGQRLKDVKLRSRRKDSDWVLQLTSDAANGELKIPDDYPKNAMNINIDALVLEDIKSSSEEWRPQDIPPMNITIGQLTLNKMQLGRVELSVTPKEDALLINHLRATASDMRLMATGSWRTIKDFKKTLLTGSIASRDMGQLLQRLNITDNMVGAPGTARFTLGWFDTLFPEGLDGLNGNVQLQFKEGRINKLSEETQVSVGLGRILNLLSLQSLPRRLSFDFSDLNQSGYQFDTLNGNLVFLHGVAFTDDLTLAGTVANVQLAGRIGLRNKDVHLQLLVTPHVTSSLPVVAAIAGGPVVGVATWFAEKAFSKATDRVTSLTYNVTGPWGHPIISKKS